MSRSESRRATAEARPAPRPDRFAPQRIVCLSAESADICARLGAWDRVIAVTAFASQEKLPPKPVVSGFSTGDAAKIAARQPDLVITFSDVQAELTAALIRAGCTVLATNPRTLAEIAQTICLIGSAIGCAIAAEKLALDFEAKISALRSAPKTRPRVYFEEWPEPLIAGIGWISEIIELIGGTDILAHCRAKSAQERVVTSDEIIAADPQIIFASWCGKKARLDEIAARPRWREITAIRTGQIYEIDSSSILQPGPALLRGAQEMARLLALASPADAAQGNARVC